MLGASLVAVLYVELRKLRDGAGPQWLAEMIDELLAKVHGAQRTYHHEEVGGNFRMAAVQAVQAPSCAPVMPSFCVKAALSLKQPASVGNGPAEFYIDLGK